MSPARATDPDDSCRPLTRSYEDLRRAAVAGAAGDRIDLRVMLGQGLWAWIDLVGSETMRSSHDRYTSPLPSPMTTARPSADGSELVSAWADLLLGRLTALEAT